MGEILLQNCQPPKMQTGRIMKRIFPTERNRSKTGRFGIKVLYPQFLQEKTTITQPKGYRKCLRKNIILVSNKI